MGDQVSTTTNQAGQQTQIGRDLLNMLPGVAQSGAGQLGDLSNLANGQVQLTAEQRDLIGRIQDATMSQARGQQEITLQNLMRQLEDSNIARGVDTSSIAAVNQALLGQQSMADLNSLAAGSQGQAANMMLNMPFQTAQAQLGANTQLLNRLVQPAQLGINYDVALRGMTGSQQTVQPFNVGQAMFQLGGQLGAARLGGGQ